MPLRGRAGRRPSLHAAALRRAVSSAESNPNPPFSPAILASAWLHVVDLNTTDGSKVLELVDHATSPANASITIPSPRAPFFKANGRAGRHVLRFDPPANGDNPQWFAVGLNAAGDRESFVVAKSDLAVPVAPSLTGPPLDLNGAAVNTHWPWLDGSIYQSYGRADRTAFVAPAAISSWGLWHLAATASAVTIRFNGSIVHTLGTATTSWPAEAIVGGSNASFGFLGEVAEVVLTARSLSAEERTAVVAFLSARWQLGL